jgi:biotin carboxylase
MTAMNNHSCVVTTARSSLARPRVLVVGAGPFQMGLIEATKELAEVVAIDGSSSAPGLAVADHAYVIDVRDTRAIVDLARKLKVDGALTGASDVAVPAVSAIVDELGLVGLPRLVSERCRDKQQAFEAVRAAALAVPETRAVSGLAEVEAAVRELGGFPVVVKPRSGGGGRGVSIVRTLEELGPAIERTQAAYLDQGARGVLVQQLVEGRSLGAEAFFVDGQLIDAFVLDDQFTPDFVSPVGHSLPPDIDAGLHDAVIEACAAFGAALGLTTSAVNFDLRCNERVVLIEVNPRLGGNSISDLIYHAYGSKLPHAAVACALGKDPKPALARTRNSPIAARLILQRGRGVVRFATRPEALAARSDVIALDLTVQEGESTSVHVDDFCVLGRCVASGASADLAAQTAQLVAEAVAASVSLEDSGQGGA